MEDKNKFHFLIALACLMMGFGVALGAFASHGLKKSISDSDLAIFETGVRYQIYHSFGIFFVGILGLILPKLAKSMKVIGFTFFIGILLFSGSLYALVFTGIRGLGMITPFGGSLFILGWFALFFIFLNFNKEGDLS